VVLKVRDGAGAEAREGRLAAGAAEVGLPELRDLVDTLGRVEPLFDLPLDELADLRSAGEARGGQALADLSQYFLLVLDGEDPRGAVRALRASAAVEEAYLATRPPAPPGDVFPATPLYDTCGGASACQGYLDAAPGGIDARWAWTQPSGKGAGRRVADVEYAWNIQGLFGSSAGHEDLSGVSGQVPSAPVAGSASWVNPTPGDTHHGTAVAGVLSADLDAWGVSGVAPNATLRVSAAFTTSGLNIAAAILRAARVLRPGDTLLVEMQNFGPNYTGQGQRGMVPVEYYGAEYNAIRQVTALCIHVVEAAGNGEQDFGSASAPFGDSTYLTRFDPRVRHSGATLVGAATSSAPHLRMWFSNFGLRVDAYAWGENVVTLGYGDLFAGGVLAPDVDQLYTSSFAGTSSASAIVAGASTVLNATHVRLHGASWRPLAMERCLRTSGTDTSLLFNEQIGRQPDLRDQLAIVGMGPQPALVFTDESSSAFVLDVVASVGDLDQDGAPDYAVGSSQAGGAGRVTLHSGLTGEVLATLNGGQLGEQFGRALAGAGDVNGDGVPDLVVGAPRETTGGVDAGKLYVYSGANLTQLYSYSGQSGGNLGHAVAMLGDVDGDGRDDFAAGAFGQAGGTGEVRAYSGQTGALLYTWSGSAAGSHFGQAVAAAGDVDGDGAPDVLVGAPFSGPLQNGSARVYSGASGALLRAWDATDNYGWFGFSVAGVGDVDGDGRDDVLIGSPNANGVSGRATLYSGGNGGELHAGLFGGGSSSSYGFSVAGAGDFDGDGTPDLLIGAPLQSRGSFTSDGAVHVHSGATGQPLQSYRGQSSSSYLGQSVAGAGDLDGDGRDDVLLGAQWWGSAGSAGRGYVFLAPNPALCLPRNGAPQ
jgi:hypothetical protein